MIGKSSPILSNYLSRLQQLLGSAVFGALFGELAARGGLEDRGFDLGDEAAV